MTDDKLCFVCQKNDPVWQAMNQHSQTFRLCNDCASEVCANTALNNKFKVSLNKLGLSGGPVEIKLTRLDVY